MQDKSKEPLNDRKVAGGTSWETNTPGKSTLLGILIYKISRNELCTAAGACPGEPVITGTGEEVPAVADKDWRKWRTQKQQGLLNWDPGTLLPLLCTLCLLLSKFFTKLVGRGTIFRGLRSIINEQAKQLNLELKGQFVIILELSCVCVHTHECPFESVRVCVCVCWSAV